MSSVDLFLILGAVYLSHNLTPRFRSYMGTACMVAAVLFIVLSFIVGKKL